MLMKSIAVPKFCPYQSDSPPSNVELYLKRSKPKINNEETNLNISGTLNSKHAFLDIEHTTRFFGFSDFGLQTYTAHNKVGTNILNS